MPTPSLWQPCHPEHHDYRSCHEITERGRMGLELRVKQYAVSSVVKAAFPNDFLSFPQISPDFPSFFPQFSPVLPSFSKFSPIFMTSKTSIFLRARWKNDGAPDRQEETHKKYIIHFTEIQFSPVLPSSAQFCPVFPSFPQFSSVLLSFSSNFIEFHPVSPSFAQFCPVLPSFPQFLPVLPSFARFLASYFSFSILQWFLSLYSVLYFVHVLAVHVPNCPYHSGIAHFYKPDALYTESASIFWSARR